VIVGSELRRRRNELRLSLRELAESTGLSTGFLSQIENDHVSPSLASLERIGNALRLPLFEILSADNRDPVVRADQRPLVELQEPAVKVDVLTNFMNWQMLPYMRRLEPGEKYEAVRLERAREEWMFVLNGAMELNLLNQDVHRLERGDSVHFASGRLVSINSVGEVPLEIICMMTPPPI